MRRVMISASALNKPTLGDAMYAPHHYEGTTYLHVGYWSVALKAQTTVMMY